MTSVKARLHDDLGLFLKYKLWAPRYFLILFFHLKKVAFFQKVFKLRFQTSYVGGKERARNLLQDAPENDSVAARRAEL